MESSGYCGRVVSGVCVRGGWVSRMLYPRVQNCEAWRVITAGPLTKTVSATNYT